MVFSSLNSRLVLILGLVTGACTGDDDGDSAGTGDSATDSTTGSTSETGSSATGSATETVGTTAATTTSGSGTTTGSSTTAATTSATTEATTTSGGVCEYEPAVCELIEGFGDFTDCGVVGPQDDAAAWQAAHDCAAKALAETTSFKLITYLQGIDSEVGLAYLGLAGGVWQTQMVTWDSSPCGGGFCEPSLFRFDCGPLEVEAGCTVAPNQICLTCQGMSGDTNLCEQ